MVKIDIESEKRNLIALADRIERFSKNEPTPFDGLFRKDHNTDTLQSIIDSAMMHHKRLMDFATDGDDNAWAFANRHKEAAICLNHEDAAFTTEMIREYLA